MNQYFIYDPGVNCCVYDTQITKWCAPEKVDCGIPNIVLVVPDGEQYECVECCDGEKIPFTIPFVIGDEIHIQTQIIDQYNSDPDVPISGFGSWIIAEVIDGNGNVIGTHSTFGSGFVGWTGRKSFQVIKLLSDTEGFPDCFHIRYRVYEPGDPTDVLINTFVSQTFKKINTCDQTILIEGIYNEYDCRDQFYGDSEASVGVPFNYINKLRFQARLKDISPDIIKDVSSGGKVVGTTVIDKKAIEFTWPLPAFMLNYITQILMGSDVVKINGSYIGEVTSVVPTPIEDSCSSELIIEISNQCKINKC